MPPQSPLTKLLIASALDPAVYRRLIDAPEQTFIDFQLPEADRDLLRHPDHRLLHHLGTALAQDANPALTQNDPPPQTPPPPTPEPPAAAELPDLSLLLTIVPCAQYTPAGTLQNFAFAAWVSPLPQNTDPASLPLPPNTSLPGTPLPPLLATIRVCAVQMQDPAGKPLVGLTASLLQSTNMTAPAPTQSAGNPAEPPFAAKLHSPTIQSAIAAVRSAPANERYDPLISLLQLLQPEASP